MSCVGTDEYNREREFWMGIRQGLRMIEAVINKRYGFEDPCCKELDRIVHSRQKNPGPRDHTSVGESVGR